MGVSLPLLDLKSPTSLCKLCDSIDKWGGFSYLLQKKKLRPKPLFCVKRQKMAIW